MAKNIQGYNNALLGLGLSGLKSRKGNCLICNGLVPDIKKTQYCIHCQCICKSCLKPTQAKKTSRQRKVPFCSDCDKDTNGRSKNLSYCLRCCNSYSSPGSIFCSECNSSVTLLKYQEDQEINDYLVNRLVNEISINQYTPETNCEIQKVVTLLSSRISIISYEKNVLENLILAVTNEIEKAKIEKSHYYGERVALSRHSLNDYAENAKQCFREARAKVLKEIEASIEMARCLCSETYIEPIIQCVMKDINNNIDYEDDTNQEIQIPEIMANNVFSIISETSMAKEILTTDETIEGVCFKCGIHKVYDLRRTLYCLFCETECRVCNRPQGIGLRIQEMFCNDCDYDTDNVSRNNTKCFRCQMEPRITESNHCLGCEYKVATMTKRDDTNLNDELFNSVKQILDNLKPLTKKVGLQIIAHENKSNEEEKEFNEVKRLVSLLICRVDALSISKYKLQDQVREKKCELEKIHQRTAEEMKLLMSIKQQRKRLKSMDLKHKQELLRLKSKVGIVTQCIA